MNIDFTDNGEPRWPVLAVGVYSEAQSPEATLLDHGLMVAVTDGLRTVTACGRFSGAAGTAASFHLPASAPWRRLVIGGLGPRPAAGGPDTPDHGRIFVEEFKREMARLARESERGEERTSERLLEVEAEIDNLSQNMLAGILSPTLAKMLAEREAEQAVLKTRLEHVRPLVTAEILPHPVLLKRFEEKVADLRSALNDKSIRRQAAETLSSLIESVTIYPGADAGPEAEVVASVTTLMALGANENSPGAGGLRGSSVLVVAGGHSERCHTMPVVVDI